MYVTEIYSLSFDPSSTLIGLTSVRGTLHLFKLGISETIKIEGKDKQ